MRKDKSGVECVRGIGIEGEHKAIFVTRLLTTGHNDSGVACNDGLGSSLKERDGVARVFAAGVGSLTVAASTGECEFALVCLLLTSTFLTG